MKKIYNLLMLAALAAAAFSCTKETTSDNPSPSTGGEGTPLSITVGTETKTLLRPKSDDAGEVRWSKDDRIKLFNENLKGSVFTTKEGDVKEATFTCENWVGGTPVVAVHSSNMSGSACTDVTSGPKVKTYLNPTQVIRHNQSYAVGASASIGLVSKTESGYSIQQMKNLFSLIRFRVNDTSIVKITMTGNDKEHLAGWMNVDYNAGSPTCEIVEGEGKDTLTITATGSACKVKDRFNNGTTYYISLLPQTLSDGFKLELEKANGAKATREISSSVTLARNQIRALKHPLDSALAFDPITMTLSFKDGNWPFNEEIVSAANQNRDGKEGETYTYTYDDDGEKTCSFELANPAGSDASKNKYYLASSVFGFLRFNEPGSGSWIKLPAIDGRKLFSVTVSINNTSGKTFYIKTAPDASKSLYSNTLKAAVASSPVSATFTSQSLSYNTSYYLYVGGKYFQITELSLVYDK